MHEEKGIVKEIREIPDVIGVEAGEEWEGEEDLKSDLLGNLSKVVVFSTDWTAETIIRQIERGNILMNPKFQRRDAWSPSRKSRFIESVMMGLPIPQLVFAEQKGQRGKYIVIDGKQRLLSLQQFALPSENPLRLRGLSIRKELNGLTMDDISKNIFADDIIPAFQNQPIRTVVIRNWGDDDVLYLIFSRLNTESVKLSPQELRQALHPGPFIDFAEQFAGNSVGLMNCLGIKEPDFRMRDVEIIIRYFGFYFFLTEYRGTMKVFLDQTCERLNKEWGEYESSVIFSAKQFELAISMTYDIFGSNAFKKYASDKFENRNNRAVMDIMLFYFSQKDGKFDFLSLAKEIVDAFTNLCSTDTLFLRSLESSTKSLEATATRLIRWGEELRRIGCPVRVPIFADNCFKEYRHD